MKKVCFHCRDDILYPIIHGRLKRWYRTVALDIGCAESLFDKGLFKPLKVTLGGYKLIPQQYMANFKIDGDEETPAEEEKTETVAE